MIGESEYRLTLLQVIWLFNVFRIKHWYTGPQFNVSSGMLWIATRSSKTPDNPIWIPNPKSDLGRESNLGLDCATEATFVVTYTQITTTIYANTKNNSKLNTLGWQSCLHVDHKIYSSVFRHDGCRHVLRSILRFDWSHWHPRIHKYVQLFFPGSFLYWYAKKNMLSFMAPSRHDD